MGDVRDFFNRLFDVSDWPPRWYCGEWTDFHGWLYILSDLFIWLSYFTIPFFLLYFVFKKDHIPLPKVFWLFGSFILLCGLTHLVDAAIFWWPAYRLSALIRFVTAVVSVATMIALFRFMPFALALRTSSEFEEEIRQREATERKLRRIQTELRKKNLILETKNREIQQFASIVSHDLKAPLQSFDTMTDLLEKKFNQRMDADAQQMFEFLQESTGRMRSVIVDLLDHARLGNTKKPEEVDLNLLLEDIIADLKGTIEESGTTIELQQSLPRINGLPTELRMLFQNLLSNAIKFTHPDTPPLIKIRCHEGDDAYHIEVEDNGIGIKPEDQESIFIIFNRVNQQSQFEGSGIGLANAKRIVELHGGSLWVESLHGKGSTFHFTLNKEMSSEAVAS